MLRDNPHLLVLDVRMPEEFHGPLGHLFGAVNIPVDQLEARLGGMPRLAREPLLVYCSRGPCGAEAMQHLKAAGFSLAVLLEGGIEAWIDGGFGTLRLGTEGHDAHEEQPAASAAATATPPPPGAGLPRRRG